MWMHSILETPFGELPSPIMSGVISSFPKCVGVGKMPLDEDAYQKILDDSAAQYHQKYKEFKLCNDSDMFAGGSSADASSSNMI
jgi:hypothetical protein